MQYVNSIQKIMQQSIDVKKKVLESPTILQQISEIANLMVQCYENDNKILICGNGGSASDAQHIEGELVGRFQLERVPLNAIALTANTTTLTAVGNDYSFDNIFSRQVRAYGKPGDILLAISTSGNSMNIIKAMETAKELGVTAILLSGKDGGKARNIADISVIIPSKVTARIQECHIMIAHILCELVEKELFKYELVSG